MIELKQPSNQRFNQVNKPFQRMISENSIGVTAKIALSPSDIVLLKAEGNYTKVFLSNGTALIFGINLGKLEHRLSGHPFFRTHKSFMVNLNYIHTTQNLRSKTLVMNNKMVVSISRRKKKHLLKSI